MDNEAYYESYDWESFKISAIKHKIDKIHTIIPQDVNSIIDIGCGNGLITNELGKKYDITGVDRSASALKFVTTKKIEASCDHIPCEDRSFDMAFSSELLEHLEDAVFYKTVGELNRISKKYIFISVPNGENPKKLYTECPNCNFRYSISYHMRSFKVDDFVSNFPDYKVINHLEFGMKVRYYRPFWANLKHKISPAVSWIPNYWIAKEKRNTMCPKCETQFVYQYKFHPFAFLCDVLNVLTSPKKPYWLLVLMERKNA